MAKSKGAANKVFVATVDYSFDIGELHVILLSLHLFFFFNLQVLAIDYYHAISRWAWSTSLSKCQHKDQKSSKFAAIRRGCKFAVS